ncbi:MAG: phosphoribosylglycinamide formyltransferase [Bacteroidales bacterium]|nr:phosphoribosylglycinamide formyltransferase [Bacteroidales bacterium]
MDNHIKPKRIAILASGNGTNAQQIAEYFAGRNDVVVDSVIYNKKDAYVATRAKNLGLQSFYMTRRDFMESDKVPALLSERGVDYLILAGFLLLVPENLLRAFPDRIVNIHPALLPKYGGKGMYGHHVHEAVVANHEKETGITIHVVDHRYDCGTTLFQARCVVYPNDSADDVSARIHLLEKDFFPPVIDAYITGRPMPVQQHILL